MKPTKHSPMGSMKSPRVELWDELNYLHPYKDRDSAQYWALAQDMLNDSKHPAWRFIDEDLKKKLNP